VTPLPRLLVAPLVLGAFACGGTATARDRAEPKPSGEIVFEPNSPKLAAIGVDTVRATRERTVAVLPAQLVLDEDHTVRVFSPVAGRIRSLDAKPGDVVAAAAPLAHIASGDLAQATSDLAKANALATQTAAALTRAEDLFAHRVIAQKDLDQSRSDAAQAQAEAARARQRAEQLGGSPAVNGDYVLRAPIGGTVIDRTANPGAEVRPDAAAPLFTLSSLDRLWLVASAPQSDLVHLHRGDKLAFRTDAAPARRFDATVVYVSDQLDPVMRTATVRAELANGDHALRAFVVGEARLLVNDGPARTVVPTRSLVTRGGETVVFVEKSPGRFERRTVRVGDDDGTTAVILDGLAPGELVVTKGSLLLAAEAERLP
jgi:cobalt-zinc-cadmium efflux system membrane fusion protein